MFSQNDYWRSPLERFLDTEEGEKFEKEHPESIKAARFKICNIVRGEEKCHCGSVVHYDTDNRRTCFGCGSWADAYIYGTMRKQGWKPKREK